MSNGLRARIVDVNGIEILGITGSAQTLVLSLKQNDTQKELLSQCQRPGQNHS
jgi:hypothetical protein